MRAVHFVITPKLHQGPNNLDGLLDLQSVLLRLLNLLICISSLEHLLLSVFKLQDDSLAKFSRWLESIKQ
jgi:hypothetical protein